ncbi:type I restriction endonuclease subunit R [Streptomyces millisiae]|uniref:Type I restriction enzyme endonuclease subunit n=1 Tax=Streptomyces millisiae TaxID=3075542 RepID=A0ABU2LLF8_9ACTN|nr:HsdR family type I site-specific deoxyribonuclease [Streptomyces sp. DSM 44918]MDT0318427.1 HsdR family type I site-specific deoxyribonuclease [Streptomyces sp. DSM 44918]
MFSERSTVQAFVTDRLVALPTLAWEQPGSDFERAEQDVLVESEVRAALVRLNPAIAADPDRAEEVLYRLTALIRSARGEGLIKANESLRTWLLGAHSMPFGPEHEHVAVQLIDFDDPSRNRYHITTEVTFRRGGISRRFDHVLWVNGFPLVVGESKSATRPGISWADGVLQLDGYQQDVPEFFVSNALCFATDGRDLRFGGLRLPPTLWSPWWSPGTRGTLPPESPEYLRQAVDGLLHPSTVLNIVRDFTVYSTDDGHRKVKNVCRYQQYEAGRRMADRAAAAARDPEAPRKGLVWHFQGSGKSLLMVFTAQALRSDPRTGAPTVVIVVDRLDLDTQITSTFRTTDIPNVVTAGKGDDLGAMLATGQRKIIVTTVHKFRKFDRILSDRRDIVCLVDEAHRTQDRDMGQRMRQALPNAVFFGLTGTPINRTDVNTFRTFGYEVDEGRYLSRYTQADSLRDGTTLPLHFEPRDARFKIDGQVIDAKFEELAEGLSPRERAAMANRAARMGALIKAPERIRMVCEDIARHFTEKVAPEGFKAQVVVFDQEACVLYKERLDALLGPQASEVVMSTEGQPKAIKDRFERGKSEEAALLDRFRAPNDPLKILIVTAKLLTGFDAPIAQTMYLDKVLRDHTLLQAVCRVNRPYKHPDSEQTKSHGLIVDYLGVFARLGQALRFDERAVEQAVTSIEELWAAFPGAVRACLEFFPGVDRTADGYEALFAAQDRLPDDGTREAFAEAFARLARLWEALSPDPRLSEHEADYRWLAKVHQSVRPSHATTPLLWRVLGPKTRELVNAHIHADLPPERLDTLILDARMVEYLHRDPRRSIRQLQPRLADRLGRRRGEPRFDSLAQKLERLREQYEAGQLVSREYLFQLLELAKQTAEAEAEAAKQDPREQGKYALTRLFESSRSAGTPVAVAKLVEEIDNIVAAVRFPGWQHTAGGEREVKRALRRTLVRYHLQRDEELFQKAYDYIRQYY